MSVPIKFYADEHVARSVVGGLCRRGVDVLTVVEAGMQCDVDLPHLDP